MFSPININIKSVFSQQLQLIDTIKNNRIVQIALAAIATIGTLYCCYKTYKFFKAKYPIKSPIIPSPNQLPIPGTPTLPKGSVNWKNTFVHVDILNSKEYILDGQKISLRTPVKPDKIEIDRKWGLTIEMYITAFKAQAQNSGVKVADVKPAIKVIASTTDEAIANGDQHKIALNFANAEHAGGGPGIYREPVSGKVAFEKEDDDDNTSHPKPRGSARAQEEALVAKSTLFLSLLELGTTSERKSPLDMIRNYYNEGEFDSTKTAYLSDDQLFAVGGKNTHGHVDFYCSEFLDKPRDVTFVTSAAEYYGSGRKVDVSLNSKVYLDAQMRIQTHLFAAAAKAIEMKKKDSSKPVELILGAYGCGAFAPGNAQEYATMIAQIYEKELPKFNGFFDQITFAIPTNLGPDVNVNAKTIENYNAFLKVFP